MATDVKRAVFYFGCVGVFATCGGAVAAQFFHSSGNKVAAAGWAVVIIAVVGAFAFERDNNQRRRLLKKLPAEVPGKEHAEAERYESEKEPPE